MFKRAVVRYSINGSIESITEEVRSDVPSSVASCRSTWRRRLVDPSSFAACDCPTCSAMQSAGVPTSAARQHQRGQSRGQLSHTSGTANDVACWLSRAAAGVGPRLCLCIFRSIPGAVCQELMCLSLLTADCSISRARIWFPKPRQTMTASRRHTRSTRFFAVRCWSCTQPVQIQPAG